jgi:hypothetical protein
MKLKRSSLENSAPSDAKAGGAFISARLRNPEEQVAVAKRKPDIIGGVCAILATIILAVTVAFLYMTWDTFVKYG